VGENRARGSGTTIETIIREECAKDGISDKEIKTGSHKQLVSGIRAMIAYRSRKELDYPQPKLLVIQVSQHQV